MSKNIITASGRRKASSAQVRMVAGSGKITINGKDVHEYLPFEVRKEYHQYDLHDHE